MEDNWVIKVLSTGVVWALNKVMMNKNRIAIILSMWSSVGYAQNIDGDRTFNPNSKIYDILDSNGIFYIGLYDRILMSRGTNGFVAGKPENLKKFDSVYQNVAFQTIPDTNHIIGIWSEMCSDKLFSPNEAMVNRFFDSGNRVMGCCEYETPFSIYYDRIIIYEYISRWGLIYTSAIGRNKNGIWKNVI